jgi:FG-GAP-like repeat
VAVNDASNDITVLLGNGDGTFTAAASHSTIKHPFPIAVGDFNGDGKLDLAISSFDSNAITILSGKLLRKVVWWSIQKLVLWSS